MHNQTCFFSLLVLLSSIVCPSVLAKEPLRAGIIGCDTSHVIAFTKLINDPKAGEPFSDVEVTVAYPGGSDDIKESFSRRPQYVKQLGGMGIKIVDSLEELAAQSDVIMLES